MVHIIPLFTNQRRPDPRHAAPGAAPTGPLDPYWQEVADHYARRMARQQAFDTEIAARRLDGEIARAEADVAANAPADGEGLHHAMYGEVDPHTGRVLLEGRFDTLFDNFLKQAPPELRAGLASRKPALREAGSVRMAMQQNQRRAQYEQDRLSAAQAEELDIIANSDPDDHVAFDAARYAGLDLIGKMNLDPESRLQAEAAWRERAATARIEALIARDPQRALEMLGGAGVTRDDQPSSLSDRINRNMPAYGNYGGRGWTGGTWGGGFGVPPIDIQDGFYKQHDADYHDAKTPGDTILADRKLAASLKSYLDNEVYATDPALKTDEERRDASKYARLALRAFRIKIAGDVALHPLSAAEISGRDEAQRAYDDAQAAVGRARFESGMSFGNW
ncbi:hypothetical protein LCM4577_21610 [Mesorhizobium sp. LCM 4577]|nr:hypothetical protein LCM4577_21610 [Mesorhizobium sp. LCM 4577]